MEDGIEETLTYCDFPGEHYWTRIRTNNVIERLNREIRRYSWVVSCFQDGNSPLVSLCPAAPCSQHPMGQQEVHEHETPRGCNLKIPPSLTDFIYAEPVNQSVTLPDRAEGIAAYYSQTTSPFCCLNYFLFNISCNF